MKINGTLSLKSPIDCITGISTVRKKSFASLGVYDLGDLCNHFPRGYQNRKNVYKLAQAPLDTPVSLILTVGTHPKSTKLRKNLTITKFKAFDESASCEVVFYNRVYADKSYVCGSTHRFYGKLTRDKNTLRLSSPESEPVFEGANLLPMVPVYPLSSGLTQKTVMNAVRQALDILYPKNTSGIEEVRGSLKNDPIPAAIRRKYNLCTREYACENIHFPKDEEALKIASNRLAFEELFLMAVRLSYTKSAHKEKNAPQMKKVDMKTFTDSLDYELTSAQKRVCDSISKDMSSPYAMSRLVSGDVGSGKTVCAASGVYIALENGYQAAMMVPTEILARQHYSDLNGLFSAFGYKTALLLGATKASEKKKIIEGLKSGEIDFVIGTHTLISDKVEFDNLGLVITDEQHRFGVRQRSALSEKTKGVHVLVMSATPIPRTLALILYGDLDVSQIDEMPPGRQKVDTFVVNEDYRERLYSFIRKQVDDGHRVYIVCPTVEESEEEVETDLSLSDFFEFFEKEEKSTLKSTVEYAKELKEVVFPDLGVGYIHGKMKSGEKEAVMKAFAEGEIQILVSTTVIEVGVNVPEATLMIVENAERFGLSQLHQLRGRVGRGRDKSYCVLVSESRTGSKSSARLDVMKKMSNGYEIAEKDLEQRGPGDFLTTSEELRQHGKLKLRLAKYTSSQLIMDASEAASKVIEEDSALIKPENACLRLALGELERERAASLN